MHQVLKSKLKKVQAEFFKSHATSANFKMVLTSTCSSGHGGNPLIAANPFGAQQTHSWWESLRGSSIVHVTLLECPCPFNFYLLYFNLATFHLKNIDLLLKNLHVL